MKIICRANTGSSLNPRRLEAGYTIDSVFHVTRDKEYLVGAMALWPSGLAVLISDDTELPRWYPIELFSISDSHLPERWEFSYLGDSGLQVNALWGYPALIQDPEHHDRLSELAPDALGVFYEELNRAQIGD